MIYFLSGVGCVLAIIGLCVCIRATFGFFKDITELKQRVKMNEFTIEHLDKRCLDYSGKFNRINERFDKLEKRINNV